jgi:hypothetical protein
MPDKVIKIPEEILKELEDYRHNSNKNTSQPVIRFKIYLEELENDLKNELEVLAEIKKEYPGSYEKFKRNLLNLINSILGQL